MVSILILAKPYEAAVVRKVCVDLGHQAHLPQDSQHLGQWVEENRPDLVVLSTRMGQGDPVEILGGIRSGTHGRNVPVVLLDEPDGEEPELAVDRVLSRPIDPDQFCATVRALTETDQEGRAVARRVEQQYSLVCESDYFTLLGLSPRASGEEVEGAYEKLRVELDPEGLPPEVIDACGEQLSEILEVLAEARRILVVRELREAYRAHLEEEP